MNISRLATFLAAIGSVLVMLLAPAAVHGAVETASPPPVSARAACSPGVPAQHCQAAIATYEFVISHSGAAPPGHAGNRPYRNDTGLLPAGGAYSEYDIYPRSGPRGGERLVIDRNNPEGNSWFTADHYVSFVQFYRVG